jgi:GNAT superfamily N-acetyltransferase
MSSSAKLTPVRFSAEQLLLVQDFDCGKDQVFQVELSDWIAKESILALTMGVEIWLYKVNEVIAGFGALGLSEMELDDGVIEVQNIPALAVESRHQGHGYFHQIIDHLIEQARKKVSESSPLLTLEVHPDNFIKESYRKKGFVFCPGADYLDKVRNIKYLGMVRDLRR